MIKNCHNEEKIEYEHMGRLKINGECLTLSMLITDIATFPSPSPENSFVPSGVHSTHVTGAW